MLLTHRAILAAATTTLLLTLWRRHRRWQQRQQLQQRLLASAEAPSVTEDTPSTTKVTARPIDSCREWGPTELASLHYSADYIFVYKQYDLHMDHASVPVTLATQLMGAYPQLADAKTAFGFRHVHQLDFATSGEPGHIVLQPGHIVLQPGHMGLQPGYIVLQPG